VKIILFLALCLNLSYDTATGAAKGITAGRKGYKSTLFEGGINVPFIARWPPRKSAPYHWDGRMIPEKGA